MVKKLAVSIYYLFMFLGYFVYFFSSIRLSNWPLYRSISMYLILANKDPGLGGQKVCLMGRVGSVYLCAACGP